MTLTLEDCREYLETLGMGEEVVERGLDAVEAVRRFLPADPQHLFVSEGWDKEGNRRVEGLWLLGADYMSEVNPCAAGLGFDVTRVDRGLTRIVVDPQEFDFAAAGEESRLKVTLDLGASGSPLVGTLEATGDNCLALQRLLESYLLPLLTAG